MSEVKRFLPQKTPIGTVMKESTEGYWIQAEDFDAQRMRADTAEAELKAIKESMAYRGSLFGQVQAQGDAAEQRIAELGEFYDKAVRLLHKWVNYNQPVAETIEFLNPKPEAGSHE